MESENAILLIHCPDKRGIVSEVTDFLLNNEGNIIALRQHVDPDDNYFYMRIEWELDLFNIPKQKIAEYFETLVAQKFSMNFQLRFSSAVQRVAIFVSKYAHCLYDILARYESKEWSIEIPLIISNHEDLTFIADRHGIPFYHIPITKTTKKEQEAKEIALLKKHEVDLIVLARYMQILSSDFTTQYPDRIINIHHSSLPAFPGGNPYKSAHKRGVKFMGATSHYVTAELDAGPIIAQDVIPISHRDSIAEMKRKGRDVEKMALAKAIWAHLNHAVLVYKNKTVVFD